MQKISEFYVLPISYSQQATHYMYIRLHASKPKPNEVDPLPENRTLFAVNLPPDATEREIITLFNKFGAVERVSFAGHDRVEEVLDEEDTDDEDLENEQEDIEMMDDDEDEPTKPRKKALQEKNKVVPPKVIPLPTIPLRRLRKTGGIGHIVFKTEKDLNSVLSNPMSSLPLRWPKFKASSAAEPSGLAHYLAKYRSLRPPLAAVKEHADTSMEVYEYKQEQAKKNTSKYKKGEAIVDEDGFTLVTRGGAYGQTLGGGVGVASKRFMQEVASEKRNKKKKDYKKEGFYAFQVREKRIRGRSILLFVRWPYSPALNRATFHEDGLRCRKGEDREG
jgi:ribosomal RNA-processing protein 7